MTIEEEDHPIHPLQIEIIFFQEREFIYLTIQVSVQNSSTSHSTDLFDMSCKSTLIHIFTRYTYL